MRGGQRSNLRLDVGGKIDHQPVTPSLSLALPPLRFRHAALRLFPFQPAEQVSYGGVKHRSALIVIRAGHGFTRSRVAVIVRSWRIDQP